MADQAEKTPRRRAGKATLAVTADAVTKRILGADLAKPATVQLPQALSEIHVSPDDVIPAGTVITKSIADEAGLDQDDIEELIEAGHMKVVEVYAMSVPDTSAEGEA